MNRIRGDNAKFVDIVLLINSIKIELEQHKYNTLPN